MGEKKRRKKKKDLVEAQGKEEREKLVFGAVQGQAEPQHLACCTRN